MNEKSERVSIEEMSAAIKRFIDRYWGTAVGERIYHKMMNTYETDYDGIKDIYDEIKDF